MALSTVLLRGFVCALLYFIKQNGSYGIIRNRWAIIHVLQFTNSGVEVLILCYYERPDIYDMTLF